MVFDDAGGSLSNSPASVTTPDDGNFDFEMLDASESMSSLYQQRNPAMLPSQASQASMPAMDAYFTDQGPNRACLLVVDIINNVQKSKQLSMRPWHPFLGTSNNINHRTPN